MATFVRIINGGALVTKCTAPSSVRVSATNVGFSKSVTLSWSGASGGAGNPIVKYYIYRNGSKLTETSGTSVAVTSPGSNSSFNYKVQSIGKIPGFNSPISSASATLTSKVSAVTAPTAVSLDKTDLKVGKTTTLRWSGAKAGTNNPITGYDIFKNGAYYAHTSGTTYTVTAASSTKTDNYFIRTTSNYSGMGSGNSGTVYLKAHSPEYTTYYFDSSRSFTIPAWAESVNVAVAAGGGGGGGYGWNYVRSGSACAGGGGGGGSGNWKPNTALSLSSYRPGTALTVTVGGGGSAGTQGFSSWGHGDGGKGGTSSVGNVSCEGGNGGICGDACSSGVYPNGGQGGNGGFHGGGGGAGKYSDWSGSVGSQGGNGSDRTWVSGNNYYCFSDPSTSRCIGQGGNGGTAGWYGKDGGGISDRAGTRYGTGGMGGWGSFGGSYDGGGGKGGSSGLVAIRVGKYI